MGYDLARTEEVFANKDNHDWLGSQFGLDLADSVTLDSAAFRTAFPSGEVPAGVEISRNPDNGRYIPGIRAAATGVTASDRAGFLTFAVQVREGVNPIGARMWIGQVIAARVPLGVGGAAPAQANHRLIELV